MILLVDDERREMASYVDELRLSGLKVEFRKDVSVAWRFFEEHLAEVELLVLDIMMPAGALLKDAETDGGLRTGVRFYEMVRQLAPDLPVLIFTNVADPQVAAHFQDEHRCWFFRKENVFPFELAEEVMRVKSETAQSDLAESLSK